MKVTVEHSLQCGLCQKTRPGLMLDEVDGIATDPNNGNQALCGASYALGICVACIEDLHARRWGKRTTDLSWDLKGKVEPLLRTVIRDNGDVFLEPNPNFKEVKLL